MQLLLYSIRDRLDRIGVVLSGLCAAHCLASLALFAGLGLAGGELLNPMIHRVGLLIAVIVAAVAIGRGAVAHRQKVPFVVAMTGLTFMGAEIDSPSRMAS